ncbi:MarR family EPS-associated transcriptional regulator [Sphingomonas sp. ST-64]|uniref:MarR family EPS-associated transcriptional regulator n=1 Tax=Sphingomonas plantiphila TaxID=3163295 RepID=A0ABW8YIW4_9SPHN
MSNRRSVEDRIDEEFRVLRVIEQHPEFSQRQIAKSAGASLGAINYCIRSLVEKGYVKVENFRKSESKGNYIYVLTPSGIAARAALTAQFLRRKIAEYEVLKAEIDTLRREVQTPQLGRRTRPAEQEGYSA